MFISIFRSNPFHVSVTWQLHCFLQNPLTADCWNTICMLCSSRDLMARFHCRVQYGSVRKGAARIAFPPPKVGVTRNEPYSFCPRLQYSSVGLLRQIRATHALRWLVDRIVTSGRRGDKNKQTVASRYYSLQRTCPIKRLHSWGGRGAEGAWWIHCGYTVSRCYDVTMFT
jgi:hypothetical protein